MNKIITGISAAALAAGIGLGVSELANAETPSPTPTPSATSSTATTTEPSDGTEDATGHRGRGPGGMGMDTADLASKLGISEDKLKEALDEMSADREAARQAEDKSTIDQAVTDGKLTQAEADAVQKAIDEGIVHVRRGPSR